MIYGSRYRSTGLVILPRSQMIHDLLDDLICPAPGRRILFSGHNYHRNQGAPHRREGAPIMDRREPGPGFILYAIEPTMHSPASGLSWRLSPHLMAKACGLTSIWGRPLWKAANLKQNRHQVVRT
jgi:transposase